MDTATAILWTQIPIALGITILAYLVWSVKKELVAILKKLSKR